MGKEEGQETKISFHGVKWSRSTCGSAWRSKLRAERLGKCGSDFLHRRYEAAYAFLGLTASRSIITFMLPNSRL